MAKYFNLTSIFGAPSLSGPVPTDADMLIESQGEVFKVPYSAPVAQGAAVANATGAGDVVDQLNALLASLRSAGIIAT